MGKAHNHADYALARQRAITVIVGAHREEYQALYQRHVVDVLGPSKQGQVIGQAERAHRQRVQQQAQRQARRVLWVKYRDEWEQVYRVEIERLRG